MLHYEPLDVLLPTEMRNVNKKQAEQFFAKFMAERGERAELLCSHLNAMSITTAGDGWLDSIGGWYFESTENAMDAEDYDYRYWAGVALDIWALAGDRLIEEHSHLRWVLFRKTKRWAIHNQPAVVGFRDAAEFDYAASFWETLVRYATPHPRRRKSVRVTNPLRSLYESAAYVA